MTIKKITKISIFGALYVSLCYVFQPISFGIVQFRISDLLFLLVFFNKDYIYSIVIGTFIANITSPFGIYDMVFGTLQGLFSCVLAYNFKNLFLASLTQIFFIPILALSFYFGGGYNYWYAILMLLPSIFIISIIGYIIFKYLPAPLLDMIKKDDKKWEKQEDLK